MKKNTILAMACLGLAVSLPAFAQLNLPRESQKATVSQRVGITDITIAYSRPHVKGRKVWGDLVPYGMNDLGFGTSKAAPWRAGANENTTFQVTHDVQIEGKTLKAGTYGFHVELKENGTATLIFSNNASSWGSYFYDPKEDVLRVTVATQEAPHCELLAFAFNKVETTTAVASLLWEKKEIPFRIEAPVTRIVLADIREKLRGTAGFSRQSWEQAAQYALNNGGDLNEAMQWISNAIEGQFYSQKTASNLGIKAAIYKKMEQREAYLKTVDEAAEVANTNQLNTLGYQMLNDKEYERALRFFKRNVQNNPADANGYDSLGEAYKTMGDNRNAIKNLQKALTLNPAPNVRSHTVKLLKELGVNIE